VIPSRFSRFPNLPDCQDSRDPHDRTADGLAGRLFTFCRVGRI
jgi:hypothetical protein